MENSAPTNLFAQTATLTQMQEDQLTLMGVIDIGKNINGEANGLDKATATCLLNVLQLYAERIFNNDPGSQS